MQPRSTDLKAQRRAVRRLLKENDPTDAMAAYYAFHHPDDKTTLVLTPEGMESDDNAQADGYVALSRTGQQLARPISDRGGRTQQPGGAHAPSARPLAFLSSDSFGISPSV